MKSDIVQQSLSKIIWVAAIQSFNKRSNDFVKECMQQNFIFSSMRYKFEHKSLPITVEIDITFKQIDLKINITRTWRTEDDGKDNITPLPSSEQDEYIDYFQNVAWYENDVHVKGSISSRAGQVKRLSRQQIDIF